MSSSSSTLTQRRTKRCCSGARSSRKRSRIKFVLSNADAFQLPGIGEIGPEGPPDRAAHPGPQIPQPARRPMATNSPPTTRLTTTTSTITSKEALSRQAAMRCQYGLPRFRCCQLHGVVLPPEAASRTGNSWPKQADFKPADIEEIFRRFHAANPEPKGELHFGQSLYPACRGRAFCPSDR